MERVDAAGALSVLTVWTFFLAMDGFVHFALALRTFPPPNQDNWQHNGRIGVEIRTTLMKPEA
jgi:hypothetical protein